MLSPLLSPLASPQAPWCSRLQLSGLWNGQVFLSRYFQLLPSPLSAEAGALAGVSKKSGRDPGSCGATAVRRGARREMLGTARTRIPGRGDQRDDCVTQAGPRDASLCRLSASQTPPWATDLGAELTTRKGVEGLCVGCVCVVCACVCVWCVRCARVCVETRHRISLDFRARNGRNQFLLSLQSLHP